MGTKIDDTKNCIYFQDGECKGYNKIGCPFQYIGIDDVVNCGDLTEQRITGLKADIIVMLEELDLSISEIEVPEPTSIEHIYWHSGWSSGANAMKEEAKNLIHQRINELKS